MFHSTLLVAIGVAVVAAGLTLLGTGSLLLAFAAYVGTGMGVLMATLAAELLLIDSENEHTAEDSMVPATPQG